MGTIPYLEKARHAPTSLIVNADDFGMSVAINNGIIQAHCQGIVSSTSLMANGIALMEAITWSRQFPELDIGIHLSLVDGFPVCSADSIASLIAADGKFYPDMSTFARRYLCGFVKLEHVERELQAQIQRLLANNIAISHANSHQHVHMLPGIYQIVRKLAGQYSIVFIRAPRETQYHLFRREKTHSYKRLIQQWALWLLCQMQSPSPCYVNDAFAGFYNSGALNADVLRAIIHHLPQGKTTELMCHPGLEPSIESDTLTYYRNEELASLINPDIQTILASQVIHLTNYRDISSAQRRLS